MISINAEGLFAIWIDGVAAVRVRALVVSINGVCHDSSEGSRGFDQWGLPRFERGLSWFRWLYRLSQACNLA